MATSILLLVLVHVVAAGGSAECWSNCKTCYSGIMKWVCLSCYEGSFGKREGAYSVCVDCPDGCISCSYYGFCDKCSPGRYGRGCEYNCSEGCVNNTCDKGSGECTCKDGFAGLNCSQCVSGRYGPSCQFSCNNGCKEGTCDPGTGSCICNASHIGKKCDKCVNGKYGIDAHCTLQCPSNCTSCESDQLCNECKPGYYGVNCQLSCPAGCLHGNCSKVHGFCQNLACKSGYKGARCNRCIATGKYGRDCNLDCIHNCLRCSTNVTCEQCSVGYWGSDCTNPCPKTCKGQSCNLYDGSCLDSVLCKLLNVQK